MKVDDPFCHEEREDDRDVAFEEPSDWPKRPFTASRLEQAIRAIDPETAEVKWRHVIAQDPYGIEETPDSGKEYFARSAEGGPWIWFHDLPQDKFEHATRAIDPETAEVTYWWADTFDPYDLGGRKAGQVGREWFARSSEGGPWILLEDLPAELVCALREKGKSDTMARAADEGAAGINDADR